jgi:hypothetical protein
MKNLNLKMFMCAALCVLPMLLSSQNNPQQFLVDVENCTVSKIVPPSPPPDSVKVITA